MYEDLVLTIVKICVEFYRVLVESVKLKTCILDYDHSRPILDLKNVSVSTR